MSSLERPPRFTSNVISSLSFHSDDPIPDVSVSLFPFLVTRSPPSCDEYAGCWEGFGKLCRIGTEALGFLTNFCVEKDGFAGFREMLDGPILVLNGLARGCVLKKPFELVIV